MCLASLTSWQGSLTDDGLSKRTVLGRRDPLGGGGGDVGGDRPGFDHHPADRAAGCRVDGAERAAVPPRSRQICMTMGADFTPAQRRHTRRVLVAGLAY